MAFCFFRLIALQMHAVHQLDVRDQLKGSWKFSLRDAITQIYSKFKMPDFKDDKQKLLR